jgi:hypothetical protein
MRPQSQYDAASSAQAYGSLSARSHILPLALEHVMIFMTKRVTLAGPGAALAPLRKVEVVPKAGLPPLFAVYTMCRAEDAALFRVPSLPLIAEPSPPSPSPLQPPEMLVERVTVRTAGGKRTAQYVRLLEDLGIPTRDSAREGPGEGEGEGGTGGGEDAKS